MSSAGVRLLERLDAPRRDEVAAITDLDDLLAAHLAAGLAEWPTVVLEPEVYFGYLADKLRERADEPADLVIRTMPAADLYLAAACTAGDPAAISAFRDAIVPILRPALGKLRLSDAVIDETEQRVLIMILVGDPVRPAIAGYGGRGRLQSWVRSIAVRTGRRFAGVTAAEMAQADDELDRLSANVHDPQLALLRERHREQVRGALADALTQLKERARTVLRQYYIDGLTIDQLATLYRVDRATTARWVIAARSAVLAAVRERLSEELGASTSEVESILRVVRSQLDISLRLLD
jgi:RNA polymerase sigma-70 factor (ECF subfamily)